MSAFALVVNGQPLARHARGRQRGIRRDVPKRLDHELPRSACPEQVKVAALVGRPQDGRRDPERIGDDTRRQLSGLLDGRGRRERGGELLQAPQPLLSGLLALEETRALHGLRRVMGEHREENALVLVEGTGSREDERRPANCTPVHDEWQARIRKLVERLELGPLLGDWVAFAEVGPRLEKKRLVPQYRVAHGHPRLERDSRLARLHALIDADGAHQCGVRGRIVDGPHDHGEGPHGRRRLINDDPCHFFGRQRLAQAGGQLEELPHVQDGPRLTRARVAAEEHRGKDASRVRTLGARKADEHRARPSPARRRDSAPVNGGAHDGPCWRDRPAGAG